MYICRFTNTLLHTCMIIRLSICMFSFVTFSLYSCTKGQMKSFIYAPLIWLFIEPFKHLFIFAYLMLAYRFLNIVHNYV